MQQLVNRFNLVIEYLLISTVAKTAALAITGIATAAFQSRNRVSSNFNHEINLAAGTYQIVSIS